MFGSLLNFDNTLDELRRMQRDLDHFFDVRPEQPSIRAVARDSFPYANIGSTEDAVLVYLYAPGADVSKFDVSIQNNLLTVLGERASPEQEPSSGYHVRERFAGAFRRVLALPEDVDPGRVEARYQNGVLQVKVARKESAQPRQIKVTQG